MKELNLAVFQFPNGQFVLRVDGVDTANYTYEDIIGLLLDLAGKTLEAWGELSRQESREPNETFGGEPTYFKGNPEAFKASVAQGQMQARTPQWGETVADADVYKQPSTLDYRSKEQKAVDQSLTKQQRVAWRKEIDAKVQVYKDRLEREYGLDDD